MCCLVLCDFQKSGTRIGPCLRFLTAVELLIKRLMIKLSRRDSWAELLPVSDRGHDLPSQPRERPPAETRPCPDAMPSLLVGAVPHGSAAVCVSSVDLLPVPILILKFMERSGQVHLQIWHTFPNCKTIIFANSWKYSVHLNSVYWNCFISKALLQFF